MKWKSNWGKTRQRFIDWWDHKGVLVGMWEALAAAGYVHDHISEPPQPKSLFDAHENAVIRARWNHYKLSQQAFPADILPIANIDIGPGSLALFCGSEPDFDKDTVWFHPTMREVIDPERLPPISLEESNNWWQVTQKTAGACAARAKGKYLVGCPDLIENVDILSALRDPQILMMDMIERPRWVEQKVWEINEVWFEVYGRIYDIVKLEDGSSCFGAFRLWGPGKTAKLQCDASAMFSTAMFEHFVVPALTEQCRWLDHSMYHLDGTQAIRHLDSLLQIDALNAIEWTAQAGIEGGGHPRWYDMYRRILGAGKSLQVVGVDVDEVIPLLAAIGAQGVYIMTSFSSVAEAEDLLEQVDTYR
ncbi:MAG: hypothetical protein GY759_15110 [Chloroflexi bacterium]|nr:hypothetical protein [Chloroflexota bacterium]